MRKKKQSLLIVIAVLLVVVATLLVGVFSRQHLKEQQPDEKYISKAESDDITRYEWISLLAEQYGLTEHSEKTPYFEDVDSDNPYFAVVQSAVEWKVLKTGETFDGDEYASGSFVALTAMRVIGQPKLRMYVKTREEVRDREMLNIALSEGLIEEAMLTEGISEKQSQQILQRLHELYYGQFSPENYSEVTYQKDTVELDRFDLATVADRENGIIVSESVAKNLNEGMIIIYKDAIGVKQAGKVKAVDSDGTVDVEPVMLEEFLESLTASGQENIDFDDIVSYCRLTDLDLADRFDSVTTKVMRYENANEADFLKTGEEASEFSIKLQSVEDDGKQYLNVILESKNGLSYELPVSEESADSKELEEGEEIQAELSVDSFAVSAQADYQLSQGLQYAEVAVDARTTMKGIVSVSSEKKLLLAEIPIPLAGGTMKVNAQIYLVVGMDGSIELKAELPMQGAVRYEKGTGFRKHSFDINVEEPSIKADCELNLILRGEPVLSVLGCNILDAEADIGMCTGAETIARENGQICMDVHSSYPTVALAVLGDEEADSLLSKLGISASWEIVNADQAWFQLKFHFERLNDGTGQVVEKCTYGKEEKAENIDAVLNGDFSEFAGSYKATESANDGCGGGKPLADLELHEDGSVSGGGPWYLSEPYPLQKPKSITKNDDGSYLCVITDESDVIENRYYIYPEGIVEERVSDEEYLIDTVYIRFIQVNGGVSDIVYYKEEEADKTRSGNGTDTYTTKHGSTPTVAVDYPKTWFVDREEMNQDYEWDVIKNKRGVEINYYSSKTGFGSQYYGGYYEMDYAHITKVADASFIPIAYGGSDYSSLGKYVVAKIKVYAYEDGLSEDGEVEYDGPTYYAVVPESYLGEEGFCGTGYWSVCSFEYVRPMVILATSPDGTFTSEEEADVIKILSSFRVN